jgi:uncharacterized SAM-binding protein YcdF (DUF218 family)
MENILTISMRKKLNAVSTNFIKVISICLLFYILLVSISIYAFSFVNEIEYADAAIVLGASIFGDKPSPVFKERLNHGIWLYNNGYVNNLIFTGGKNINSDYSESFIAKEYALEHFIPVEHIFIEEYSSITSENIYYSLDIIKTNNFNKIILVSDPLHMKRAVMLAKDYNLNIYSSPTTTTKYVSLKTKTIFLVREIFFYIGYVLYKSSIWIYFFTIILIIIFILFSNNIKKYLSV